ncbi:MAG: cation transporter [Chloroflexota bacterium]|nr:MAG: cation transporter [Chloroflexota bacterium]
MTDRGHLKRYAWLSITAALLTISLKAGAFIITGSVGLLADALESGVNLIAAVFALIVLGIAAQPPDEEHTYGHSKAEYFASGAEGTLIFLAAITIALAAVSRLLNPEPLEQLGLGLVVSIVAALLNLVVARILQRAGRLYRSITLEADAKHLMTDVWTTGGVLLGIVAVALTGWQILDPLIALVVAGQILIAGFRLVQESASGLMDKALPAEELQQIVDVLDRYAVDGVRYHALRTRLAGAQRFMSVHVQVPGAWSVQDGHSLLEEIDRDVRELLSPISVFTHLEPLEDPRSWDDIEINRSN